MTDVFVTVDSRHRDKQSDGQGDYTVRLQRDLKGILSVSVRSADVPPMWNVPKGRSSIWISVSVPNTLFPVLNEIVLEPGDYTPDTMAKALEASIEALFLNANPAMISVSCSPLGRFEITMPDPFTITGGNPHMTDEKDGYGPESAGRVLGLDPWPQKCSQVLTSTGMYKFTAPHVHQLNKREPLYLHVEDYDAVQGVSAGQIGCTEVIRADGMSHDCCAVRTFAPPLHRVSRLRVRFTDHYGLPVDFDNRDHNFELVFKLQERCC